VPYNANDHRYWRFRESGGQVYWETSSDQAVWNIQAQMVPPIAIESLRVELWANLFGAGSPYKVHFDNLNL
jgi:hypothetical protein